MTTYSTCTHCTRTLRADLVKDGTCVDCVSNAPKVMRGMPPITMVAREPPIGATVEVLHGGVTVSGVRLPPPVRGVVMGTDDPHGVHFLIVAISGHGQVAIWPTHVRETP